MNDDVQTIEMSEVSSDEMQMLLEVVYNGVVEASIEDLRKLILLAHRLYIAIPLSNELMQGLELKLPLRSPFRKPIMSKFNNGLGHNIPASGMMGGMSASNTPTATSTPMRSMLSSSLKSMFNGNMMTGSGHSGNGNSHHSTSGLTGSMKYPTSGSLSAAAAAAAKENAAFASKNSTPKLNIDPTTMTTILAHSQNNEHVCPICNSKYR